MSDPLRMMEPMNGLQELDTAVDLIAAIDDTTTDDLGTGLVALRRVSARLRAEEIRLTGIYKRHQGLCH